MAAKNFLSLPLKTYTLQNSFTITLKVHSTCIAVFEYTQCSSILAPIGTAVFEYTQRSSMLAMTGIAVLEYT